MGCLFRGSETNDDQNSPSQRTTTTAKCSDELRDRVARSRDSRSFVAHRRLNRSPPVGDEVTCGRTSPSFDDDDDGDEPTCRVTVYRDHSAPPPPPPPPPPSWHSYTGHSQSNEYKVLHCLTPLPTKNGAEIYADDTHAGLIAATMMTNVDSTINRCPDPPMVFIETTGIARSVRLSVPWRSCLGIGTLAACSLATAGHQRCADCGPVRGRT